MSGPLLPPDFDDLVGQAVRLFWVTRAGGTATQGGSRGQVISGKNMDGFLEVVRAVASHAGLPPSAIHTHGRALLTLPGYYRATKNWDALVIHERRLIAAFEFKSQVGSLGNNFNNRTEEAAGSASDLGMAFEHRAFEPA
ncbi:MAG: restriction endonuclease, partial [Myxococcales bacterium]|nr:restriction endonuclease [Myxococcales bacterium]